jgi:Flp pilus assembly protein CpaB
VDDGRDGSAVTAPTTRAPAARRVEVPRWTDTRLLVGVLLVLGSVVLGTRVVATGQQTQAVWTAARDLPSGVTLHADDVVLAHVRLDDVTGRYLLAPAAVVGRPLRRAVRAGELLPASALGSAQDASTAHLLAVPVEGTHLPPGLGRGALVDVYVTPRDTAGGAATGPTRRVLAGATVMATDDQSAGLRDPQAAVAVVLDVPGEDVPDVVSAVRSGDVDLVLVVAP